MSGEKKTTGNEEFKSLETSAIVKALECCIASPIDCNHCPLMQGDKAYCDYILDIAFIAIERLRYEKQKVVQDYYCELQTCDEQKDIIAEQKAEIEQLTKENTELQKQVDELTEGKRKLELLSLRLMNDEGHQQAVKDTVKEIDGKIQELLDTPFEGKTEKQEWQRKGMEEGLKMALEIVRECKGVEVE